MKSPLFIKSVSLLFLILILMVPLAMVQETINERASYQEQVRRDIAASWGGVQRLVGPLLVQSYETAVTEQVWDKNLEAYVDSTRYPTQRRVIFPDELAISGHADVTKRYRGIYGVPVYRSDLDVEAGFTVPGFPAGAMNPRQQLVVGVSDNRGFRAQPKLQWNGELLDVVPGTGSNLSNGVHAAIDAADAGSFRLNGEILLGGSGALQIAPLGGDTRIRLSSNWPHPGFGGGYLPEQHRISADGFEANWQASHFATTARESVQACIESGNCSLGDSQLVSVKLVDPVDVYALNDRSTKYGLLFLLVIFGVFLVYELLKGLRVHPVQYLLVGLGQALFFLLLLSLSEHLVFGLAYLCGAAACILLLSFYVSNVLGGWSAGLRFGGLLAIIYAALYVILQSEDYALLLGSTLLFALLAIAMFLTRKIDWYALNRPNANGNDKRNWQQRAGSDTTS